MDVERTKITKSLPPEPIPSSVVQNLEESDSIESAYVLMGHCPPTDTAKEFAFGFMLETSGGVYPLVLAEDGGGWVSLGQHDSHEGANASFMAWQEENGLRLG